MKINRHSLTVGVTGSGKSYFVKKVMKASSEAVLYFDTIAMGGDFQGYMKINGYTPTMAIEKGFETGMKMVYTPIRNESIRNKELMQIIKKFGLKEKYKFRLILEEVQELQKNKDLLALMKSLAQYGRHYNTNFTVISQRLQWIDKGLATQCDDMIFFKTNLERAYFKDMGIDIDTFQEQIKEPYKYAHIKNGELIEVGRVDS